MERSVLDTKYVFRSYLQIMFETYFALINIYRPTLDTSAEILLHVKRSLLSLDLYQN